MNLAPTLALSGVLLAGGVALTPALAQRPDLSGRWTFNAAHSNNPRDRVEAGDTGRGESRSGRRGGGLPGMGGGRGGFGGARGGLGGGRGGGGRGGGGSEMSDEQRQRMRQTMQLAFQAPVLLTITETDSTVTLTADSAQALLVYSDGRKLKQKADSGGDVEIKARWQGNDFVVERKVSGGGKVTEDYLRSQDGKQLFVIVSLDSGRRSIDFRRVYDAAPTQ